MAAVFEAACKLKLTPFMQACKTDVIHDTVVAAGNSTVVCSIATGKPRSVPESAWQQYWDDYIPADTSKRVAPPPEKDTPKATDVVCDALDGVIYSLCCYVALLLNASCFRNC